VQESAVTMCQEME